MTTERANEIYAQHIASGGSDFNRTSIDNIITHDENLDVRAKWATMPGWTCWADAFFTFMSPEKLPPYQKIRFGLP